MIIHASVPVSDPQHAAETLAHLMGGIAFPLPAPGDGAWMAATPKLGGAVELIRRGQSFHRVPGGHVDVRKTADIRHNGFHILIDSPLTTDEVVVYAASRGAPAHKASNGFFELVEVWFDDCQLVEIMPADLAPAYLASTRAFAAVLGVELEPA